MIAGSGQRSGTGPAGDRTRCIVVPHQARGARLARHRLAGELAGQISSDLLESVIAVVAELVGNAVRHARPLPGGVIQVAWRLGAGEGRPFLLVRVTDGGGDPQGPRQRSAEPEETDGRGLAIVAALASEWGVDQEGAGQSVWARLAADGVAW
jgi:two-component sensor histidine kinase